MDAARLEQRYGAHNYDPLPVTLSRGEGAHVWDASGRRLIDMMSAYSAVSVGHSHPRILAALNAIRGRVPAFELTIAGDGTDRARLENISRAAGLDSVVRFAGRVADNDLRNLYASSDIFVLPSSKEGFGLVYLEAMSFGLPVLAAHAGGVVDIIESGVSGLLVPPEDLAALSQALRTLITDAGERDRLARNALARVQSSFLFSHFSRRWAEWTAAVCPYAVYAAAQRALLGKASPGHLLPLAS